MAVAECWRDKHGVVHAVAMLPTTSLLQPIGSEWRTYCWIIPLVSVSEIETTAHYTADAPTCLVCVVKARV